MWGPSRIAWLILVAVLSAQAAAPLLPGERDEFIAEGWSGVVPATEAEVLQELGKPIRITRERVKNPHDDKHPNELVTISYSGLVVKILKTPDKEVPAGLVIRDPKIPLPHSLTVGAKAEHVIRVLGQPFTAKGGELRFEGTMPYPYPATVTFKVSQGVVQSIEWWHWID